MSDKEKGVGIDRELTGEIRLGKPISSKKYWELIFDTKQEAQRAVDCLQAMSGIADPQKFMEAVRELESLQDVMVHHSNCPASYRNGECICLVKKALAKLRAAREGTNF